MPKRAYYWAGIIIGLLMATAVFYVLAPEPSDAVQQRLQVQEAVTRLAQTTGCLTCHSTLNSVPTKDDNLAPIVYAMQAPDYVPIAGKILATTPTALDTRLLNLGERILSIPNVNTEQYHNTVNEFMRIYQQSRNQADAVDWLRLYEDAAALEYLIFLLELQTQPYQLKETTPAPEPNVLAISSGPTLAVAGRAMRMFDPPVEITLIQPDRLFFVPAREVVICDRAGPPAGVDSMWV